MPRGAHERATGRFAGSGYGAAVDLLLSNDDGIDAPGLAALADALEASGTTFVVAPVSEMSAQSHALTMHKPLRAKTRGPRRWSVSGTPADCVYLGINHLLPRRPALCVSGINRGSNLGNDILYSGTVAAAIEACLEDIPAIAISLHLPQGDEVTHWETAALVAQRVVAGVLAHPIPTRCVLNVNVPNVPAAQLRGVKSVALGRRQYTKRVVTRTDPWGRAYHWIGGSHVSFDDIDGTDGPAIEQDWATVTPIQPDLIGAHDLHLVRGWTDA